MSDLRFDIQVAEGLSFDELPILMEPLIPEHSMLHLPYEDRLGECYHLSSEWVSLVGREFPDHVRLVHGSIQGFGDRRLGRVRGGGLRAPHRARRGRGGLTVDHSFWKGLALALVLSLALWAFIIFALTAIPKLIPGGA